ncbi:uncharacterized protein LOC121380862 [Gigantopelta aegis]|uniref:uncharacterized protein LOC121380862 n=1 Tax=Gigantopelta aegis TaxID=1735272 RepID=UPI001B88E555|nr:uncharacterized protein LOC121380862 [Gigantopelta aegis]
MDLKTLLFVLLFVFTDVFHCEDQSKTRVYRRKRLIFGSRKSYKAWRGGVIPYCFDPALSAHLVPMYNASVAAFERHTCITFRYHANCATIKGGGIKLTRGNSPSALVGKNWSLKSVKLSIRYNLACHELFHVIGGFHEQNNYKSIAIAPQMYDNIQPRYQSQWRPSYSEKNDISDRIIHTINFDLSSPALYSRYGPSKSGFPVYDVMYPDQFYNDLKRVFLDQISEEINQFYKCWDLKSCGTKPICDNEGYPGYYNRQCGCVCPRGLESSSNCAAIKTKPSGSWPDTDIKLLKTTSGCPAGLTESTAVVTGVTAMTTSSDYNLATALSGDTLTVYLCSKPSAGNTEVWDHGMNGFLAGNNQCPSELRSGEIKFSSSNGSTVGSLKFCVQQGLVEEPLMGLPTTDEFAVFSQDNTCQEIDGFVAQRQWLMIKHPHVTVSGPVPKYRNAKHNDIFDLTLRYCVYTPLTYNCGGVFKLNSTHRSVVINSPNFPSTYPQNTECNWFIEVEEGARIKAEFSMFDVNNADSFTYRRYILKSVPTKLLKRNVLPQNLVSVFNHMALHFRTGSVGSGGTGFQINVTRLGAEDYCYSLSDKGESYDGDWNYAEDGTKCLPWDLRFDNSVTISGYTDYEGSVNTFLTGSACRNPQGRLHKPACLTYAKGGNYSMRYCDVCHNEYGTQDKYNDCDTAVSIDPSICTGVTAGKCLYTCETRGLIPTITHPPKVGDVTCSSPSIPPDATLIPGTSKSVYHPGDKIQLNCTTPSKQVTLTCLSSGNWSEWNEPCKGCPAGWAEYSGQCWKVTGRLEKYLKALKYCRYYYQASPMTLKTNAEHDFFLEWKKHLGANKEWWMYASYFFNKWRWNGDGSLMSEDETASSFGWQKNPRWGRRCVIHNIWKKWGGGKCTKLANFICQKPLEGRPLTCTDRKEKCATLLRDNPLACIDPVVKTNVCAYTCGAEVCKTSGNECSNLPTPEHAAMVEVKTSLGPGEFVQYTCDPGYDLQSGSLTRACLRNGQLSGNPPVCVVSGNAVTSVNDFPMGMFISTTREGYAYTGESQQFKIARSGYIYSWQVYCANNGEVYMQVWRKQSEMKYQLIGQTIVQCFTGISRDITLNSRERIPVQSGDEIGFFDSTGGVVTYYPCNPRWMPEFAKVHIFPASPSQMRVSAQVTFLNNYCQMFAVNAKIGP